jgi:hypothetical protein
VHVLTVAALAVQVLGSYVIWPNRWNIPAHLNLGFCVTAYFVPGLGTDVWDLFDDRTNLIYSQINILGALALVGGLLVGSRVGLFDGSRTTFMRLYESGRLRVAAMERTQWVALVAVIGMIAAYRIMGFVPMFAEDPFSAKQFKNEYFEPYYRAAYLFRSSFSILVVVIPLLLTIWWVRGKSLKPLLLSVAAVALIAVSLARQSFALGIITFMGILATRSARAFRWFMIFNALIFPLGSAAYLLLGLLTGVERFTSIYSVDSIADVVSSGAPDIYDQLNFLNGFQDVNNFTYGRTFFGGLVPGNFVWNPSVWSLTYDNLGADISDLVSGGLRFTTALWGYCSFGWGGVVLVPFFSGLLNGSMIRVLKSLPLSSSLMASAFVMSIYMTLGHQLSEFYLLSIHAIPSIACALFLAYGIRGRRRADGAPPPGQELPGRELISTL